MDLWVVLSLHYSRPTHGYAHTHTDLVRELELSPLLGRAWRSLASIGLGMLLELGI